MGLKATARYFGSVRKTPCQNSLHVTKKFVSIYLPKKRPAVKETNTAETFSPEARCFFFKLTQSFFCGNHADHYDRS